MAHQWPPCLSYVLTLPTRSFLLQCRLQMGQYAGPAACLRAIVRHDGVQGLTRGLGATLLREIPGNAIFFTVYESLRRALPGRPSCSGSGAIGDVRTMREVVADASSAVVCGAASGVVVSGMIGGAVGCRRGTNPKP